MMLRSCAISLALVFCAGPLAGNAWAQRYPAKPVRVIMGFPAGSGADVPTRIIGQKLSESMGQQFLIDNRPGAGSNIGTALAAKAAPDGYTLFLGSVANTINATLYESLPFDFVRDFAPVALTASAPNFLVVHPSVPAHSVAEFIKLAKSQPGKLNYASVGVGTMAHLAGELFNSMAGINTVHIPYKGGPQATTDIVGGQFPFMFGISSNVLPHLKSGRLRALAVTTAERLTWMPEMPTVAESGLPGFAAVTWWGLMVPAGTPREIVAQLNAEIVKVLAMRDVREQLAIQGIDTLGGTPEE
jgi:tripartite-type tricarboxylate transporter receptor subunit TctC